MYGDELGRACRLRLCDWSLPRLGHWSLPHFRLSFYLYGTRRVREVTQAERRNAYEYQKREFPLHLFPCIRRFLVTVLFNLTLPLAILLLLVFQQHSVALAEAGSLLPPIPVLLVTALLAALFARFDVLLEGDYRPLTVVQTAALALPHGKD